MPTFEQFRLPDAGEGLTEAEVVTWHVAVGDAVTVNQAIVEIETAKSLVELPSPFTGVVTEILVATGTTVEVGTPIIVIDTDPSGTPRPESAAATAADPAPGPGASGSGTPAPSSTPAPSGTPADGAPAPAPGRGR
uniref:biotin/lipoyl-containing protein n=1 Tax=uncultured Cellulomonas sp. TaxID=189682 RepID=UPI0026070C39